MIAAIRDALKLPPDSERFFAETVMPAVIILLLLVPALATYLGGRDVELVTLPDSPIVPDTPLLANLLQKFALGLVLVTIATNVNGVWWKGDAGRDIYTALLVYFVTCVLLPAIFGKTASFPMSHLTFLALMTAIFAARHYGTDHLLSAVRDGLFIFMVLSLIANLFYPNMTRRYIDDELRLPYLDYRFWGLSDHSNSIATMASTSLLLTLAQPYSRKLLTVSALSSAIAVQLMCQSQTSWIGAILSVIVMLAFRQFGDRLSVPRFFSSPLFLGPSAILLATLLVTLLVAPPDMKWFSDTALAAGDQILTGRGRVWQIALQMFIDNPVFGYGLNAWDDDFRAYIGLSWAVHAHNQILQVLSIAGIVGFIGFAYYIKRLTVLSFRQGASSRGLAPALLMTCFVKSVSETPLDIDQLFLIGNVAHAALYITLVGSWRPAAVDVQKPLHLRTT